jgi:hypothetical protein
MLHHRHHLLNTLLWRVAAVPKAVAVALVDLRRLLGFPSRLALRTP